MPPDCQPGEVRLSREGATGAASEDVVRDPRVLWDHQNRARNLFWDELYDRQQGGKSTKLAYNLSSPKQGACTNDRLDAFDALTKCDLHVWHQF